VKKLLFLLTALVLLPLIFIGTVYAKDKDVPKNVVLARGEVINSDYFVQGDNVTITGTVNGDVYAFGGKLVVDGLVNGDLIAAGGIVEISGNVNEDVRVGAGQINVYGNIGGSLTAGSGNVFVDDDATIGESVVIGAGSARLDGPIGRGATIGSGDVSINNRINGSVVAGVGQLTVGDKAELAGGLNYWSENEANISPNAKIGGEVTRHIPENKFGNDATQKAVDGISGIFSFIAFASSLVLGLLILRLAPVFSQNVIETFKKSAAFSIFFGFIYLVLLPFALIILAITVVGIPLAIITFLATIISLMFVKVFVSVYIGEFVQKKLKLKSSAYWALFIGLVLYTIFTNVPVVGWMFAVAAYLGGLGAVVLTKKQYYHNFRAKKLI